MIRALVFDFDGLILETEAPRFQSWQEIYQSYGYQLDLEKWVANIGKGEDDFDPVTDLELLVEHPLDREYLLSLYRTREHQIISTQPAMPGVEDYLSDARRLGLKIGLASCSSCEWVIQHLKRLGIFDYFECIQAADDVQSLKPHPELYLKALECLEVQGGQAVAFEDSPYGVLAAKRAGMYCVAVPNPLIRMLPIHHADILLDSLSNMPLGDLLQRIES